MQLSPGRARACLVTLAMVVTVVACAGGARSTGGAAGPAGPQAACAPAPANTGMRPLSLAYVLDGRLLARDVPPFAGAGPDPTRPPEFASLAVDDVFDMDFVTDAAALARLGLCPGTTAVVVTTVAEARRRGLRPPPPALCIRSPIASGPELVLPVGDTLRVAAGQLDILHECDRPAPAAVRWASSDPGILEVDSAGIVRGRAVGRADLIASADSAEARLTITVVAR